MNLRFASLRDIGRKRSSNQDAVAIYTDLRCAVVADGMGGHQGGEIASQLAVQAVESNIRMALNLPGSDPVRAIDISLRYANSVIFQRSGEEQKLRGMGTTAVVAFVPSDTAYFGNVGDSRAYLLLPGMIWQLTRDHSLVSDKVKAGLITREQARTDAIKNVITRSVGYEREVTPDVFSMGLIPGSVILLCSDGLSGMIEDAQIQGIVDEFVFGKNDLDAALTELIAAANEAGGLDNISAVLIAVEDK